MSIKTFFEKVGHEIKQLFGKTTLEQEIQATINYGAPVLLTVLSFADPAAEPAVAKVVKIIQADLATISTVVQGAEVAPGSTAAQTVETALSSVVTNLSGLLQVAEVKNSAKSAEITSAVNLLSDEFNAVLVKLAPPAPAAITA